MNLGGHSLFAIAQVREIQRIAWSPSLYSWTQSDSEQVRPPKKLPSFSPCSVTPEAKKRMTFAPISVGHNFALSVRSTQPRLSSEGLWHRLEGHRRASARRMRPSEPESTEFCLVVQTVYLCMFFVQSALLCGWGVLVSLGSAAIRKFQNTTGRRSQAAREFGRTNWWIPDPSKGHCQMGVKSSTGWEWKTNND